MEAYVSITDFDQARFALRYLLETKGADRSYWALRDKCEMVLEEHPFGLETHLGLLSDGWKGDRRARLIASPECTEMSVDGMLVILQHQLRIYSTDPRPFRLRIIRAQFTEDSIELGAYKHNVYFELITVVGTFICGGCADGYVGEGPSGGKKLEAVFNLIASFYELSVEEVVIPLAEAVPAEERLGDAYAAFMQERSMVEA